VKSTCQHLSRSGLQNLDEKNSEIKGGGHARNGYNDAHFNIGTGS